MGVTKTGAIGDSRFSNRMKLLLGFFGSLCLSSFSGYKSIEFLHQAALTAGGGVLMNDAFFSGLIEHADRLQDGFFGFRSAFLERCARLVDSSTGGATDVAIFDATLFVLLVTFDL